MAIGNPYRPSYGANDWTSRLPPGSPSADTGMVVQPYADPGYGMPNAFVGNLNQAPGLAVGGALRANVLQSIDSISNNPLAGAPQQIDYDQDHPFYSEVSPLERFLAQQRAKNNARGFEPLPGITSGAAPKPWGLDRAQLPQQARPPTWEQQLSASRPADYSVDPRMQTQQPLRAFKMPGGGTVYLPIAPGVQPPPPDIFGSSPYSSEFNSQSWRSSYDEQQT
jgi:hypothetical protein